LNKSTKRIVKGAVISALVFIVTWSLRIPVPATSGAYINPGDAVIYITSFLIGGPEAIIGAAIGSALADLLAGAAVYIFPTFIIKGIMALITSALLLKRSNIRYIIACLLGGAVMTLGYGAYELFVFGSAYAIGSLPANLIQWAGGSIIAIAFLPALKKLYPLMSKL
jgi:uncharacterized membrane protein